MYLHPLTVFGYSVGHVHNDLCSAMWFTYLLVFMESVLHFDAKTAGLLLLIGQVTDAIATPLVGLESDRSASIGSYGKRKSWHLFGTIASAFSFPMIFQRCYGAENSDMAALAFYYAALIVIFQIAWASVQISHLSLATELTPHSSERVKLTARRSGFQVASNILVYMITWLVLHLNADSSMDKFSAADQSHFRLIVVLLTVIGLLFSAFFHLFVQESSGVTDSAFTSSGRSDPTHPGNHLKWYHWFRIALFYRVALLYMSTRLVVNLTQVFIPMYLQYTLNLHKVSLNQIEG
jgi:Na+/melibiose symporter-like transporter